ncbi:MAG: DMT family transporter [Alphaproteobacteria bacterium]|nr:DMT family transporter [Alphaproteobacteria bacterium]
MSAYSNHVKGLAVTAAGYLVLSPEALIIRLVTPDHWTIVFWRGAFMAIGLIGLMVLRYRGMFLVRVRAIGRRGALIGGLFTISSICFVTAISFTTVANALVIISVAPLFAAIFSLVFLREPVALRTWIAITVAIFGIGIIVYPSLYGIEVSGQSMTGDLAALGTAVSMAAFFTVLRRARDTDMMPALALSALLTMCLMAPLSAPLAMDSTDFALLAFLGLVIAPLAFTLIATGPRYISAPEVGLLMPMETVLAPIWVWLVLAENPGPYALAGGGLVIATLLMHSLAALRSEQAAVVAPTGSAG